MPINDQKSYENGWSAAMLYVRRHLHSREFMATMAGPLAEIPTWDGMTLADIVAGRNQARDPCPRALVGE